MATARTSVKIANGAVQTKLVEGAAFTILRGVVDPDSLELLQVDGYQREKLGMSVINGLIPPILNGMIPDVILGVRGDNLELRDGHYYIKDMTVIIDGQQRVATARYLKQTRPETDPRLGATIFFGTTPDIERWLFIKLNTLGTRLSPNVILRDLAPDYPIVADIIKLTANRSSSLFDKVNWNQRMIRGLHLLNGMTVARVIGHVHGRFGPTIGSSDAVTTASGLQKVSDKIGSKMLIANGDAFFDLLDTSFGLRRVKYKESATQIKGNFLTALARVLRTFDVFWELPTTRTAGDALKSKLVVPKYWSDKLRTFPIGDPEVMRLAASGSTTMPMLYMLLIDHLNKGKRRGRLLDPSMTTLNETPETTDDGADD